MSVPAFDEKQRPGAEERALAVYDGYVRSGDHIQPLITAAVAVIGVSLRISGSKHHLRRLRMPVAQSYAEAFAESEGFAPHS